MSQKVGIMGITLPSQVHFFFLSAFPFFRMKMIQAHRRKFGEQQSEERKKSPTFPSPTLPRRKAFPWVSLQCFFHAFGWFGARLFVLYMAVVGWSDSSVCLCLSFLFFSLPSLPSLPQSTRGGCLPVRDPRLRASHTLLFLMAEWVLHPGRAPPPSPGVLPVPAGSSQSQLVRASKRQSSFYHKAALAGKANLLSPKLIMHFITFGWSVWNYSHHCP